MSRTDEIRARLEAADRGELPPSESNASDDIAFLLDELDKATRKGDKVRDALKSVVEGLMEHDTFICCDEDPCCTVPGCLPLHDVKRALDDYDRPTQDG